MPANHYPNGAGVRLFAKFRVRNDDQTPGALTNPTTVIFEYESPNGTETTVTYPASIVRPTTGIYYLDIIPTIVGTWRYRLQGDTTIEEGEFVVNASVFA